MMNRLRQLIHEIHRRSLWQVLLIYVGASWAVLQVVDTIAGALQLPEWLEPVALVLLIVGLPIVMATAFVQEGGPGGDVPPPHDPAGSQPAAAGVQAGLFTWRNAFGGGVLAFALWGVMAAGWVLFGAGTRQMPADVTTTPGTVTERVFVMPLDNLTDESELDVIGRLAADEIARAIDRRQPVAVVPSATVAATIRTLGDGATVEAVAAGVHATHAFAGTVAHVGDELRFNVELIDPRTSERLRSVESVSGPATSIDSLVTELAALAATEAVVVFNPAAPPWVGDMSSPVSVTAYQAFLEQGRIFCTGDDAGSIAPGERAVRESPRFVAALYQMMQAYSNMGNDVAADSLIAILEGLRGDMTRNEELSLDWMIAVRRGDLLAGERATDEAYRLDPVGRSGASMMMKWRLGKMTEAIERLANLELPGACPWPGYYQQGTIPYHMLAMFEDELDLILGGLAVYPGRLDFLQIEARALVGLGHLEAVDSIVAVMAEVPAESDRRFRAWNTALELEAHGHRDRADQLLESMVTAAGAGTSRADRARAAALLSDLRRWEEAIPVFASLDEDGADVGFLGDFGVALARTGRFEEALTVSARIDRSDAADVERYLAKSRIAAALGDGEEAVDLLGSAFELGANHGLGIHLDNAYDEIRGYRPFEALVRPR